MRGTSFAWVVIVPSDDDTQRALLTAASLKRTNTTAAVLASISSGVTSQSTALLKKAFDWVIIGNEDRGPDYGAIVEFMMLECWKLTTFSKVVVLKPGVTALSPVDDLMDKIGLLTDKNQDYFGIALVPSKRVFTRISSILWAAIISGKPKSLREAFPLSPLPKETLEPIDSLVSFDELLNNPLALLSGDDWTRQFAYLERMQLMTLLDELGFQQKAGRLDSFDIWQKVVANVIMAAHQNTESACLDKSFVIESTTEDENQTKDWIAVVGMSCRFPDSNNLSEYWDLLMSGRNTCGLLPPSRTATGKVSPDKKGNFLKCNVAEFDASFFGMSPAEASATDPQTRLLLETSWEAFEDAGVNPDKLRGSATGVFYGSWMQEYKDLLNDETPATSDYIRKYLGNSFGATAAKLSFYYGFTGPNLAVENGCSSSMVAVDLACKSLHLRECSTALACGANLIMYLSEQTQIWCPDGKCKTFDIAANGYARAEGIAVLVLKRYADALKDGDKMYGIIRGCGVSQEGLTKSFGSPTVESECSAMKTALKNAGVSPQEVDYIEAHATGTVVGDPIEAVAISQAYAGERDRPLYVASVKTNIGHTESCSGLAGAIKTLLALQHEVIPPHINFTVQNPKVSFDSVKGVIPLESVAWPRSEEMRPRIAGVSSYGITGTDVHIIIQEPPLFQTAKRNSTQGSTLSVVTLSGKSEHALAQLSKSYATFLKSTPHELADIAYTSTVGRAHHQFRTAFVAETKEDLFKQLSNENNMGFSGKRKTLPKICFTFPGYTGKMNFEPVKALYRAYPTFRFHIDHCDSIITKLCGKSLKGSLTNSENILASFGGFEESGFQQCCLLSVQYSLAKLWEHWGIKPNAVMGHCLGEVAAGMIAGILRLEDGLTYIAEFMKLTPKTLPGTMMAVNTDSSSVENLIAEFQNNNKTGNVWFDIACINNKAQTTIAGPPEAIREFNEYCTKRGIKCTTIPVDLAIHSRAMNPVLKRLQEVAARMKSHTPNVSYISSITGKTMGVSDLTPEHWVNCFRERVNYVEACKTATETGFEVYLDIGLSDSLAKLTASNNVRGETLYLASLTPLPGGKREQASPVVTLAKLYSSGANIEWDNYFRFSPQKKVTLPNYPFQRKSFWFERKRRALIQRNSLLLGPKDADSVHPLLGSALPNASGTQIFQTVVNEDTLSWVFDHCIGNQVIYPAAGYLEMMLASGVVAFDEHETNSKNWTVRQPPYPIQVEELTVHQPLVVEKLTEKKVQTILEPMEGNGNFLVTVYSENPRNKHHWSAFATGTFSTISDTSTLSTEGLLSLDEFQQIFKRCPETPEKAGLFYDQLARVGLNFGRQFRSLKGIRCSDTESLAEIDFELDAFNYICHPVVSDAMIQLFIFHTMKHLKKLHVPVKIGKFIKFPSIAASSPRYVYCKTEPTGFTTKVYLLDEEGSVVALMKYPELISTSTEAVLGAAGLSSEVRRHPALYEQFWKPVAGTDSDNRLPPSGAANKWLIMVSGNENDAKVLEHFQMSFKSVGRVCECISMKTWAETISSGKLQQRIESQLEECKTNDIEGILYVINDKHTEEELKQGTRRLVEPLVCISKFFLKSKLKALPKLHVVTSGAMWIGDEVTTAEHLHPLASTVWGFLRTMRTELPGICSKSIDLDPDEDFVAQLGKSGGNQSVINELLLGDKENEVVYRNGVRLVRRLRKDQHTSKELQFPDSTNWTVELPPTKILADLKYVPKSPLASLEVDEVEVEIRSASLNFKDVLNVMKPTKEFEAMKTIGLDYSGVVSKIGRGVQRWKVGDSVFGCSFDQGTISSHLVAKGDLVAKVPPNMTFSEAATLPAVFLTAWYCMVDIANLKSGQTILIHAASGGVGLVAIQIAKLLGVNIIGTAGSARKRNFVRAAGVEHVFSSRNLEYGHKIQELTNGKGVDMVLNCLTGPGFKETSLEICREGGHFTEISKVDIWSPDQVRQMRPGVNYNVVYMPDVDIPTIRGLLTKMTDLIKDAFITPLPYVRYDASSIVDALTYLQKAKQIGKVVVEMPFRTFAEDRQACRWNERMFNDQSTYLITGGFGEIGMAVARWMVAQGAKSLVLVSRREPTDDVERMVEELEGEGAVIVTRQVDIADYNQCKELITFITSSNLPPIRGIHHCAGVIADGMIAKQDWSGFDKVYAPKVSGTFNLHKLTRDCRLEFFVMYSSLTSTFGNIGQANYTSANAYMDALGSVRHAEGLPTLTINFGQWDAGMAKGLELYSAIPFSIEEGIAGLEKLMRANKVATMAADVNFRNLVIQSPFLRDNLLADFDIEIASASTIRQRRETGSNSQHKSGSSTVSFIEKYLSLEEPTDRAPVVQGLVIEVASRVLGLQPEEIEVDLNFSDMGMDSLMSIEFTNNLQSELGDVVLGFIDMEEYGTVLKISEVIEDLLKCR